jgi:hypothetical protein
MTLVDTETGEVTTETLEDLEEIIGQGLETFVAVGEALAKVRDSKLYLQHADTFEAYCTERWGLSRPRAYELMHAAEAVSAIADIDPEAPAPANEAQARALAPLKANPPAMAAAMATATATAEAEGRKPTAADVKAAVAAEPEGRPDTPPSVPPLARPRPLSIPRSEQTMAFDALVKVSKSVKTFMEDATAERIREMADDEWESFQELAERLGQCTKRIADAGRLRRQFRALTGGKS